MQIDSLRSDVQNQFPEAKAKVPAGLGLRWGHRGEWVPRLFQLLGVPVLRAHGPASLRPHASSSDPCASFLQGPGEDPGPTRIIQANLPSRDPSLNHMCTVPCPCKMTQSQEAGVRGWASSSGAFLWRSTPAVGRGGSRSWPACGAPVHTGSLSSQGPLRQCCCGSTLRVRGLRRSAAS